MNLWFLTSLKEKSRKFYFEFVILPEIKTKILMFLNEVKCFPEPGLATLIQANFFTEAETNGLISLILLSAGGCRLVRAGLTLLVTVFPAPSLSAGTEHTHH